MVLSLANATRLAVAAVAVLALALLLFAGGQRGVLPIAAAGDSHETQGGSTDEAPPSWMYFDEATDTIKVAGQTVLGRDSTYEARVQFTTAASGRIFNEWTLAQEDKLLEAGPDRVVGYNWKELQESGKGAPDLLAASGLGLEPDEWHHVAFVQNASDREQRLYVDGTRVASEEINLPDEEEEDNPDELMDIGDGPGGPFIGAIFRDAMLRGSFIGFLDNLRISDTARYSGASITPPDGDFESDSNTLLLFNFAAADYFEENGQLKVKDASGNGHTGTLGTGFAGATKPTPGTTPIVFLHGFLGSEIECGPFTLWPAVPPDFEGMGLAADGISPAPAACTATVGDIIDSVLGSTVYSTTIDFLKEVSPENAFFFAWDWRKSPQASLTLLDDYVNDILADRPAGEKVVLMAHSYGGLLARWYIDDSGRADKVERVVTIGTPAWGAPKALFPLFAGIETPEFSGLDAIMPNADLKEFARNLMGNYFLYPSAAYGPWLTLLPGSPLSQQGVLEYVDELGGNATLLSQAFNTHAAIFDGTPPPSIPFEVIAGSGILTISSVRVTPDGFVILEYDRGDGTVPARSAARGVSTTQTHYVCDVGHVPLPGHPKVTDAIEDFLLLGEEIAGLTSSACPASGLQFRIFELEALPAGQFLPSGGAGDPLTPDEADFQGLVDYLDFSEEKFIVTGLDFPYMVLPTAKFLDITPVDDGVKGATTRYGPFSGEITVFADEDGPVVAEDGQPVEGVVVATSIKGDLDCDGDVDSVDALKGLQHNAGLPVVQEPGCVPIGSGNAGSVFGDIDCDDDVDSVDSLQVLRTVAGLAANLPPGCKPIGT